MIAVLFEKFQEPPKIVTLEDPRPEPHGVVIKVKATGVCRSDWHGWMGHDSDIELPHVPGHELAGVIEAVGKTVTKWQIGDQVTVPFISGCGVLFAVSRRPPAGVPQSATARLYALGVVRGICWHPPRRPERHSTVRKYGFSNRRQPRLSFCHRLSCGDRSRQNISRTMGCGSWLWRGRPVGRDDHERCWRKRYRN